MGINFNPNLPKNDSLDVSDIHLRAVVKPDTKTGDIEKALRTGGNSPALSRAYAQSLKEDPTSRKSDCLFEAALAERYPEYYED